MTAIFTRIFIRPSINIEFPKDPPEFTQHVSDLYVATGLCTEHRTETYSEDGLIKTTRSVWADQASIDIALVDPVWTTNTDYINEYCFCNDIIPMVWNDSWNYIT